MFNALKKAMMADPAQFRFSHLFQVISNPTEYSPEFVSIILIIKIFWIITNDSESLLILRDYF